MANANAARSDNASRIEELCPTLQDVRLGDSFNPFTHVSEPDIVLGQAYALTFLIEGAFRDFDAIGPSGIKCGPDDLQYDSRLESVRPSLVAEALAGIGTLLGLVQHGIDLDRFQDRQRAAKLS